MADRADAADARGDGRHFEEHAPVAELLEAAELVHVQVGVLHLAGVVDVDRDTRMTLDAGYGLDGYLLRHEIPPQCKQRSAAAAAR